ncbi:MAG: carbon-nitrogen hydrolase family protein [Chloroflexota bacterium]|nr:carbon-nitrogen hydrolase family protein [Chloroflexota bacterium]
MGDEFPTIKVAAVQAAPVFLDREASVEKACRLIAEAGANGARLAVFPETWLPGYPIWLDVAPGAALWDHGPAKEVFARLVANAVEVPGPATEALAAAAARAGCAVVMGINERERGRPSGTLYNSIVTFGPDGRLLGKHRKLIPTYTERLVWGRGDGSTLGVYDTPLGRIGGLVCWEHWMPLARHAMHATGEQVHAALWPTVNDIHLVASRHYAFEGRCFVVAAGSVLRRDQVPADLAIFQNDGLPSDTYLLAGGSAIIGPDGHCLAGPAGSEETILYADLDLARIPAAHLTFDAVGHYGRPDVFTLTVNTAPQTYLDLEG